MERDDQRERVVKTGTYLYDGTVVCDVRVVVSPIRWGTGDYADSPEVGEDRVRDTFYVSYGGTTERGVFISGGGGFDTLHEAMHCVEASVAGVSWNDEPTV